MSAGIIAITDKAIYPALCAWAVKCEGSCISAAMHGRSGAFMKRFVNTFLRVLMTVVLAVGLMPLPAYAEEVEDPEASAAVEEAVQQS